ncbi:MAG: helix-turn-helix domain-containing protein [Archaeoglobus sp.]|nr:helix-turn-helix domain-containing protein [Archaeoglobus sp.]
MQNIERITLTAKEVAEMLGISKRFVYELCQRNELPHKRIGRKVLFSKSQIKEWLEGGESKRNGMKKFKVV